MNNRRFQENPVMPAGQSGVILVVALIFLLILTLLGMSTMRTTVLEEKMASNTRERGIAFQSAESALRDAETFIEGIVSTSGFNGSNGLYGSDDTAPDIAASATWAANSSESVAATQLAKSYAAPRYFIQLGETLQGESPDLVVGEYGVHPGSGDTTTFRITARGVGGGQDGAEVILRTNYGRNL